MLAKYGILEIQTHQKVGNVDEQIQAEFNDEKNYSDELGRDICSKYLKDNCDKDTEYVIEETTHLQSYARKPNKETHLHVLFFF